MKNTEQKCHLFRHQDGFGGCRLTEEGAFLCFAQWYIDSRQLGKRPSQRSRNRYTPIHELPAGFRGLEGFVSGALLLMPSREFSHPAGMSSKDPGIGAKGRKGMRLSMGRGGRTVMRKCANDRAVTATMAENRNNPPEMRAYPL